MSLPWVPRNTLWYLCVYVPRVSMTSFLAQVWWGLGPFRLHVKMAKWLFCCSCLDNCSKGLDNPIKSEQETFVSRKLTLILSEAHTFSFHMLSRWLSPLHTRLPLGIWKQTRTSLSQNERNIALPFHTSVFPGEWLPSLLILAVWNNRSLQWTCQQ